MENRTKIAGLVSVGLVLAMCAIPALWWYFFGTVKTEIRQAEGCPSCICSCDGDAATLSIEMPKSP